MMRPLAAAVVLPPLLSLLSACGDCTTGVVSTECRIAGNVQVQFPDGTTTTNQAPGLDASCLPWSFQFGSRRDPIAAPQDLVAGLRFEVIRSTAPSSTELVDLELTIAEVPLGPSEIDLDDTRARLEGWSGLQGHMSITTLSQDCSNGRYNCLLELHATLAVSAVAADGGTLSLTEAALHVRDTYSRQATMCAVVGE